MEMPDPGYLLRAISCQIFSCCCLSVSLLQTHASGAITCHYMLLYFICIYLVSSQTDSFKLIRLFGNELIFFAAPVHSLCQMCVDVDNLIELNRNAVK